MKRSFLALAAAGALAMSSFAFGQAATGTTDAKTTPPRDLNAEANAMKSSAGSSGTPTTSQKQKRGKLETPEQKQAAVQEMQNRSTSSAKGAAATADPNAPKANPRKAAKDMTPEERQKLLQEAQKASKP